MALGTRFQPDSSGTAVSSRRDFLRTRWRQTAAPLRPPWALPEHEFIERCTRCSDCRSACPERIIVKGDGGFPEIDFRSGACTFCADCVAACPADAFCDPVASPWPYKARIADSCVSLHGVVCRSCGENCEFEAIRFQLCNGSISEASIDASQCNGCGACVARCPVGAIEVHAPNKGDPA